MPGFPTQVVGTPTKRGKARRYENKGSGAMRGYSDSGGVGGGVVGSGAGFSLLERSAKAGGHFLSPGGSAEGVDVFVLGERDGLEKSLAEIGESCGGFAVDQAAGDAVEDA